MVKLTAHIDKDDNIVISKDDFEHIMNCLCNQKFVNEPPPNGDALSLGMQEYYRIQKENQAIIDDCYHQGRELLTKKVENEMTEKQFSAVEDMVKIFIMNSDDVAYAKMLEYAQAQKQSPEEIVRRTICNLMSEFVDRKSHKVLRKLSKKHR